MSPATLAPPRHRPEDLRWFLHGEHTVHLRGLEGQAPDRGVPRPARQAADGRTAPPAEGPPPAR